MKGIMESIHEIIERKIKSAENIVSAVAENVSIMVRDMITDSGKTGEALIESMQNIIGATISAVIKTGKNLEDGVKALVIGTLKGMNLKGEEAFTVTATLAGAIIEITAEARTDLATAARGVIRGAIHSAKESGIDAEKVASAAAMGALKAAYRINEETGDKVKAAITGTFDGIKVVVKEPYI
ncbi:MAG TPA: hypothetical protein DEE98_07630 [Elusimicrobia bacterium]|nr:MAG: hypothetical protein A2278_00470 [Elusimicrobia bacterium RIFOXYA12_FULL_49_49]OGS09550.1 MAG: hypothetical protein A2204_02530 [Elusimicrobia bacterium RIFOXYA1_FULL_47_7]OGS11028.1 MAG: hypothetical protein A2386_00440 [Elusimicrobia bacterium RIFOXYB1_FULL_48_9]OGS15133.1 MAG: hypothetical protein A2251_00480 [Elusimicrobia bacterium RIFOXYA2_FULL_47_53]OGS29753.1 MAG: hypothetical protein A2323_01280 [Elusimicrobia bacterium RIFOXYB2_FULL_46_23]HBU70233.1 hypothetical protein [Elus